MEDRDFDLPSDDQILHQVRSKRGTWGLSGSSECYITMLEMENYLQTISIEEQRTIAEPVEGLEEILLDNARPE